MSEHLRSTLANADWVRENSEALRALLPDTWTLADNLNLLALGFQLKLLGVDWRSNDELAKVLVWMEKVGLMERNGRLVRQKFVSIRT